MNANVASARLVLILISIFLNHSLRGFSLPGFGLPATRVFARLHKGFTCPSKRTCRFRFHEGSIAPLLAGVNTVRARP